MLCQACTELISCFFWNFCSLSLRKIKFDSFSKIFQASGIEILGSHKFSIWKKKNHFEPVWNKIVNEDSVFCYENACGLNVLLSSNIFRNLDLNMFHSYLQLISLSSNTLMNEYQNIIYISASIAIWICFNLVKLTVFGKKFP